MSILVQDRHAAASPAYVERDTELLAPATQIVGDKEAYLGKKRGK